MRLTSALATAAMTSALLVTGAPAALAVCEAYSGACVDDAVRDRSNDNREPVVRARQGGARQAPAPETLPFTGGEVVMLSGLGAGAVAAGAALVVAGKRRSQTG